MVRAFYACIRAIRKQPNHFAVACGIFMFLLPGVLLDVALHASGKRYNPDVGPPEPPPPLLAPMVDLWGRFADSIYGVVAALTVMGLGILLALLGLARVFRPRSG